MHFTKEKEIFDSYEATQRRLKEMAILSEKIDRDYRQLLTEIEMTPAELKEFMENPENFSVADWERIQEENTKVEEMLNLQMTSVIDSNKNKKKYADKGKVQSHWLFVR